MFKLTVLIVLFSCICANAQTAKPEQIIHQNWQFNKVGKNDWLSAKLPGCVHTDLLDHGLIPDPYYRDNEKLVQWVETEEWQYQTTFNVDQSVFSKPNIELEFKGLDTYADVFLNDSLILRADNMYRSWAIDCKKLLKLKGNSLRILFHSAVNEGLRKAALHTYRLPNHNEKTVNERKVSSQTRKSPYQFGWDTHPRLVTCGVWRPIVLTGWSDAKMEDNFFEPLKAEAKKAEYHVHTTITASTEKEYQLSVYLNNSAKPASQKILFLKKGKNTEDLSLSISNPELWWPNGMGKPNLYAAKVVLADETGVIDEKITNIGVRTIEVVRDRDSIGRSFYFKVNGIPLFIKGSNYVPADALVTRITTEQYKPTIAAARESNLNLLRVWGGAIYEDDIFYDLCAENGILVWQDFMYACSMYPGEPEFLKNIEAETIENVKRLRNNPALAIWCGNNELISGWKEWDWPHKPELNISKNDSVQIFHDYLKIFNDIIPGVIRQYNPQTFYWPSSPGSDPGVPNSLTSGDLHYYLVWYGSKSIHDYKTAIPRFMSEYGVQSLPSSFTLKKYLAPEDENLFSPVMMHRQKSVMPWVTPDMEGNKMLMRYLNEDYNEPKDFQSLIYLSQLFQADAIKIASEAHRQNKPYCMGSMYWQFGDAWPNIGWSVIDYLGKKKAAYYIAKKAFKNITVIPALSDTVTDPESFVNVYINSDSLKTIEGKLSIKLLTFSGKVVYKKNMDVQVQPLSNKVFFSIRANELLKGLDKNELVLSTVLTQNGTAIADNLLYFDHCKFLKFQNPEIKAVIVRDGAYFEIGLMANSLAKSIYLSLPNGEDGFSDNFFDLLPDQNIKIKLNSTLSSEEIKTQLSVSSLYDFQQ